MQNAHPQILICGFSLLDSTISNFSPDLVISITDPFSDVAEEVGKTLNESQTPSISLHYNDAHYGSCRGGEMLRFEMLEEVADALDAHAVGDAAKILVHCHAGQQRSPAMAAFALGYIASRSGNLDSCRAREIIDTVFDASPHAEPDMRTLDMGADFLNQPGLFREALQARRSDQALPKKRTAKDLRGKKRKRAFRV
jgi:predicted protein tyrosine phosphatase